MRHQAPSPVPRGLTVPLAKIFNVANLMLASSETFQAKGWSYASLPVAGSIPKDTVLNEEKSDPSYCTVSALFNALGEKDTLTVRKHDCGKSQFFFT